MAISPTGGFGVAGGPPAAMPADASYPPDALSTLIFQETAVAMSNGQVRQIAPPSASRVYLAVYLGVSAANLFVATRIENVVANRPIQVTATTPLVINWATNASAVNQAWYGIVGANTTLLMHEIFYRPLRLDQPEIVLGSDTDEC